MIILCSNWTMTRAAWAMSPIFPGLSVTRWRVRKRWDIRAKPRSPRQRSEHSSALRVRVFRSSSPPPAGFYRDMDAAACAFVPGVGQCRQVLQEGPQDGEDVLTGGGDVMNAAGRTGETHSGLPDG